MAEVNPILLARRQSKNSKNVEGKSILLYVAKQIKDIEEAK